MENEPGYDLNFSTLYGAGQGGAGNVQDVMKYLASLLENRGGNWANYDWGGSNKFGDPNSDRANYSFGDWKDYLTQNTETGGSPQTREMSDTLLRLLETTGLTDLTQGYGSDIADIGSEFQSGLYDLQKGYTSADKRGRYGKIGTGGRNIGGGGRDKYMADIYGLEQKSNELRTGLQDQFQDDFYSSTKLWLGQNPPTYIEGGG